MKIERLWVVVRPSRLAELGDVCFETDAAELAKKAREAAKGKDLAANVRARMVSYTRKGWRVEKDEQKRVKVVQGA
jgi:hypothetical protein